eukprot:scaffold88703_cov29-Tisochrysis_lutea.AAC.3
MSNERKHLKKIRNPGLSLFSTQPRTPRGGWQPHGGNSYLQCPPRGWALHTATNNPRCLRGFPYN